MPLSPDLFRGIRLKASWLTLGGAFLSPVAHAADVDWIGVSPFGNFWGNSLNWSGVSVPASTDDVFFGPGFPLTRTVTLNEVAASDRTVASVTVNDDDWTFRQDPGLIGTLNATTDFTIEGNGTDPSTVTFDRFHLTTPKLNVTQNSRLNLTDQNGFSGLSEVRADELLIDSGASVRAGGISLLQVPLTTIQNGGRLEGVAGTNLRIDDFLEIKSGGSLVAPDSFFDTDDDFALRVTGPGSLMDVRTLILRTQGDVLNPQVGNGAELYTGGLEVGNNFLAGGPISPDQFGGRLFIGGTDSKLTVRANALIGRGNAEAGVVVFDGAQADLNRVELGTEGGRGFLDVQSSATVRIHGDLTVGGGDLLPVALFTVLDDGAVTVSGTADFNQRAEVSVRPSILGRTTAQLTFNAGANFNAGSQLQWSSGTVDFPGQTLLVNGGDIDVTTSSGNTLPHLATLDIRNGGRFDSTDYYDITNGQLLVDGPGSSYTIQSTTALTDWGLTSSANAFVQLRNEATANLPGTLRVGANGLAQVFLNSESTLNVGTLLLGGNAATSDATLTLTGSSALNADAVTLRAGSTVFLSDTEDDAGPVLINGPLALSDDARLASTGNNESLLAFRDLNLTGTSRIDLGSDLDLVWVTADLAPLDELRTLLADGYRDDVPTRPGITSSFATARSDTAIGYERRIDDGDPFIVVRVTALGDTDLDGDVDLLDANTLLANYVGLDPTQPNDQHWFQGDFNYDGRVSFADAMILRNALTLTASDLAALDLTASEFNALPMHAWQHAIARAAVPEPAAATLLALGGLAGRRRRPA